MPYTYDYPHPAVTVDIVVLRDCDGELQVLLVRRAQEPFKDTWALPGGFVDIDEDLEQAARRELEEETGLRDIPLEQLHAFGAVERDPRERVISVAYLARLPENAPQPRAGSDAAAAAWFPLTALPDLAFDHRAILGLARQRLQASL
ncbi:NUDIX domain-containing protein [Emcibacter nanhaiensis]|uniref:NUDIX hydrolase n=1 Tax=Emcibacter nanhaiensis TaxID=1505037 RepID=A0A501PFC4_9PROT|nr:NUDIX hydrolase [Emcibacter nanhaiensis]TPD59130.1 NUDIX hydrolase [Emcibacter nanhaiensis]